MNNAILALAIGLLALACLRIDADAAMTACQQRHSFATCFGALNR